MPSARRTSPHVAVPGDGDLALIPDDSGGVTLLRDGQPQSYVDVADPTRLEFEYVAQMGLALDALASAGPLAVTHVGGAGLTLARYVAHTRPGSPQIVLEPDAATTAVVRRELPLPRGHRIRVRAQDGANGVAALADGSADAVLLDAYAQGRLPPDLGTLGFFAQVARVLRPSGLLVANVADEPARAYLRRFAAGVAAAGLGRIALVATHDVLKGRRFGNTVLVASATPYDPDALRRAATRCLYPSGVRAGGEVARWVGGARPFGPGDEAASPPPPELGGWRVR